MMFVIVTGMVVAYPVPGEVAYLPSIGPVPLRFETATRPGPSPAGKTLRAMRQPEAAATNGVGLINIPPTATNTTNTLSAVSAPVADSGAKTNSETSLVTTFAFGGTGNSTDLILPQKLADYFQPAAGGDKTNETAVFVPEGIGFTPPLPKAAAESRAVYISQ
jgi:hypothetical protein